MFCLLGCLTALGIYCVVSTAMLCICFSRSQLNVDYRNSFLHSGLRKCKFHTFVRFSVSFFAEENDEM